MPIVPLNVAGSPQWGVPECPHKVQISNNLWPATCSFSVPKSKIEVAHRQKVGPRTYWVSLRFLAGNVQYLSPVDLRGPPKRMLGVPPWVPKPATCTIDTMAHGGKSTVNSKPSLGAIYKVRPSFNTPWKNVVIPFIIFLSIFFISFWFDSAFWGFDATLASARIADRPWGPKHQSVVDTQYVLGRSTGQQVDRSQI